MYTQEKIFQMSIEELYALRDSLYIKAAYGQHTNLKLTKMVTDRIRAIEAV